MSRCYPFPPPGYECLIDSIKETKEEAKREKKDREQKKKEKKRKEREIETEQSKKRSHKRQRKDKSVNGSNKVDDGCKLIHSEVEFLEKSCLTDELEAQTSSQNSCDSTLNNKEKPKQIQIQSQPLNGRDRNNSETGILMMTNKDQNQRSDPSLCSLSEVTSKKTTIPLKDVKSLERNRHIKEDNNSSKRLCSKCPSSMAEKFLNLIENWVPERIESKLMDSEAEEWWSLMKYGAKRHDQVSSQTTIKGSSSMMWPTARFLPEAELYALPYTVPF